MEREKRRIAPRMPVSPNLIWLVSKLNFSPYLPAPAVTRHDADAKTSHWQIPETKQRECRL
eukprot:1700574-Rhodomonas_salina.1